MLRAILNKSWSPHPTKQQLYGNLPPITKTIHVRWTRHAGQCWRSRDELISDVLLWTPSHGRAKAGRPARTYIQQLCADTGCSFGDRPKAMDNRERWQERVMDICAGCTTWWWWWGLWYLIGYKVFVVLLWVIMCFRFHWQLLFLQCVCGGIGFDSSSVCGYRHTLRKGKGVVTFIKTLQKPEKRSPNKHEWVPISLSTPFTWHCATYALWRMQKTVNIHECKNEIN